MTDGRATHTLIIAGFVAAVCCVGVTQVTLELSRGDRPQFTELFSQAPTKANLMAFEKDLEDNCWLAQRLRPWVQYALFVVMQDAGDKAILGRNGWLFYRPAVRYLTERWPADATPTTKEIVSAIVSFRDQLDARGIKLLLVPVPNKVSVYPEMLRSRADVQTKCVNARTLELMARLKQTGVEIVDLFEIYRQARLSSDQTRLYLAQDSHWSPQGAQLAAQAVAGRILDLGWIKKGTIQYDLTPVVVRRHGDILRMMQVPQIEQLFMPEEIECLQVVERTSGKPYHDDPNSQVLVLGDSFLRIYERDEPGSAGFIAHLARELGLGVTSIVNDGGASTLVRQELGRKPQLLANKKVVVWEFVERDIRFGTEGWQIMPLP